MTLRIASYNIHGWVDADMESNLERVAEVVNLQDPDILCLQVKCPVCLCCCCVITAVFIESRETINVESQLVDIIIYCSSILSIMSI